MSVWVRGNVFMLMVLKKSMLMSHLWSSEWRNETNINKSSFSNSHTANLSGVFLYTPSGYRKPFLTGWEWRGWRLNPVVCVNREWASLRCFSPHCDSYHASLMNTIRHCMLTLGLCEWETLAREHKVMGMTLRVNRTVGWNSSPCDCSSSLSCHLRCLNPEGPWLVNKEKNLYFF